MRSGIHFWTLAADEETLVPCDPSDGYSGITEFARWLGARTQDQGGLPQMAFDLLPDGGYVSTIFLGFSLRDPPILWECMGFDADGNVIFQQRFADKGEALRFHTTMTSAIKSAQDRP